MIKYKPEMWEFEVKGAGQIELSEKTIYQCADVKGFGFKMKYGEEILTSGVLSKKEAKMLAIYILEQLLKDE